MVRRRRRVAHHLDAGLEHDLHRDVRPLTQRNRQRSRGDYYDNIDFTGTTVVARRSDRQLRLGDGSPAPAIGADTFSVRWTGQVQPQFSETYTFYTKSDDGVRLWVNGRDHLTTGPTTRRPRTAARSRSPPAAVRHPDGVLRERRRCDGAPLWSSPSTPKAIIPRASSIPRRHRLRHHDQLPAGGAPVPAGTWPTAARYTATAATDRLTAGTIDNTPIRVTQRRELARPALRHAHPHAEAGETGRGLGDRRPERYLQGADRLGGCLELRQRVPDAAEGVLVVSGTPTTSTRWIEGTQTVDGDRRAADGSNGAGARTTRSASSRSPRSRQSWYT